MANVLVDEQSLQDIADAIRLKNGTQNTYTPAQMATAIEAITTSGGSQATPIFDVAKFLTGTLTEINDTSGIVTELKPNLFRQLCTESGNATIGISVSFPNVTTIGHHVFYSDENQGQYNPFTSFNFPNCTTVGKSAFCRASNATVFNLPKLTSLGGTHVFFGSGIVTAYFPLLTNLQEYTFQSASSLKTINAPNVTSSIPDYCFRYCSSLEYVILPKATSFSSYSFDGANSIKSLMIAATGWNNSVAGSQANLERVYLPNMTNLGAKLKNNTNLETLIIGNSDSSSVCTANTADFLSGTKIASGNGYIYVKDALVNNYKSASNWSAYASQIKGQSELTQSDWDKFYPPSS